MGYQQHYRLADDMIQHLNTVINGINDPFISSRYVGFVTVAAVTVFELALKDIFIEFAVNKNRVFGTFTEGHFDKINGRIRNENIKNDYIKKFGIKYLDRYNKKLEQLETETLRLERVSIKTSYQNLITWRNEFAHAGQIPTNVTYFEAVQAYERGKKLIKCVADTMNR